ncbi:MAG: hypothetical protein A3G39_09955 [Deltaproteobacteria bacterium RIFCSPLOWO2_12_FULL_43_16]|nr:MAG: hypothetical protein A2Z89_02405 [Deltaproteobacteria bacterium GWA2_43_19]OGQ10515.1 MAG: hypothetical protein A3D30_02105 [Deltaproteobacteria bacterium RIFCSPHIGHO2_02_FULL_43_33]OGQ37211.1 MAG: hypothetical protein A3A85_05905 [Deltaproteobacteria bacterium RIFCSPLOWO2_01_FULL_42_9]OGQ59513.1 MAG: hypothetical protein A3G39_09955 [Deltaproteobacteria bacterium RIFCSPLOWO2_12_FULL_43_16]HBR16565.1 hypothetical protein [Deltaproteobacteria bacterium]
MNIPSNLEKYVSPQSLKETRLMAAKALLPMGPKDLVTVLSILVHDDDKEVRETAQKSLEGIPSHLLLTVLDGALDPSAIKAIANIHKHDEAILVMIALNRNADDETLALLASAGAETVANVIAENQTRLIRNPALLDYLKTNPSVGKSVIDRTEAFLISVGKLAPKEGVPVSAQIEPLQIKESDEAILTGKESVVVGDELKTEKETVTEVEKESFYKKVQHLNVSGKIKLALLGNKEARDILLKDSNKLVSSTVLKNPRITEDEITKVVNSRSISDDILRQVANNKEWLKKYPIKLGLVNNPKAPLSIAMRLMSQLNEKDVQHIAKSKNVSSALAAVAKKMVMQKEKH